MTLGRIVSLEDAGNFAAASAGIAKAAVSWVWDGTRYVACVTVAGVGGAAVAARYGPVHQPPGRRCSRPATAPSRWRCAATCR